jgi:ABC-type lipoprotein release transport system permease subunit
MRGNSLAAMAWKNLWRNRRRTLITLSSIAFGVLLAVISTGLGDKTYGAMIDLAARMGSGHVAVQHPDYLELPSLKRTIANVTEKMALARRDPDVLRVAQRISGFTMLSTAANSAGAFFVAFDPAAESQESFSVLDAVVEGGVFESSKDSGILLGTLLAETLGAKVGRKVVYTLTDKNGEMVTGLARVTGIIRTGADTVDSGICVLSIDAVREVLGFEADEATYVAVFIRDQRRAAQVAARLDRQLDDGSRALAWTEVQPELAGFIAMKTSGTAFFEVIIMILVAAGIFNTLFVSVMERLREFGVLLAIGFGPVRLFGLVMWESLWLALTGLVASVFITAWPYYALATTGLDFSKMIGDGADVAGVVLDPVMRVGIFPEHALLIGVSVVLATLLAGVYPAWKAARVVPVESIKLV